MSSRSSLTSLTTRLQRLSRRRSRRSRNKKMQILIFIAVLVVLIVVHEFGHFIAAKLAGMRVDEFGLGYPPRAVTIAKVGETRYTLNWLPFGGFVKIFGEDASLDSARDARAFSSKTRLAQAFV